jgi:uncharacterized protein YijF (DUF1287 family)
LEATPPDTAAREAFRTRLVAAAVERANHVVRYDPGYVAIPYPNGDVPQGTGVCSDEIIRTYRALGIDLQKEVHEDIVRNPAAYAKRRADANIDHRRVENLIIFFRRHGESLPITKSAADYQPGDLVTWDLHNSKGSVQGHIGIVVNRQPWFAKRYMILHNIGSGPQIEDVLFDWKITGHFRYYEATNESPIGIGGRVAPPPLPHHRTCGSAYGGSAG